jgi:hypothetical protein
VRVTNRVPPSPEPNARAPVTSETPEPGTKLFAPEGSAEGCASGECLPGEEPASAKPGPRTSDLGPLDDEPELPLGPTTTSSPLAARWKSAIEVLRQALPRHGKSLTYARLISLEGGEARVNFGSQNSFHRATIFGPQKSEIEKLLSQGLGAPHKLSEDTNQKAWQDAPRSLAELEADDRATREKDIDGKARDSSAVRSILKYLGGNIEHIQVLDPPPPEEPSAAPPPDDES